MPVHQAANRAVILSKVVEALEGKRTGRSSREPDSASLHQLEAANLPKMAKPATEWRKQRAKAAIRASRGDWGQHVRTDQPRNLGGLTEW